MAELKEVHLQGDIISFTTHISFELKDGSYHNLSFPLGITEGEMAKQFIELGESILASEAKKNE